MYTVTSCLASECTVSFIFTASFVHSSQFFQKLYSAFHGQAIHLYKGIRILVKDECLILHFIEAEIQAATLYSKKQTEEQIEEPKYFRPAV